MIAAELIEEGFEHINPSLAIWVPSPGESVRGYILGRQLDRDGAAFYVVQLTRDLDDEDDTFDVGTHVGIFESPTIEACQKLLPNYQRVPTPDDGERIVAIYAFEVVFTGGDETELGYPDAVFVAAKRITAVHADPAIHPPPAPFTHPCSTKRLQDENLAKLRTVSSSAKKKAAKKKAAAKKALAVVPEIGARVDE